MSRFGLVRLVLECRVRVLNSSHQHESSLGRLNDFKKTEVWSSENMRIRVGECDIYNCCTEVEFMPRDLQVVGSNPTGCQTFFLSSKWSMPKFILGLLGLLKVEQLAAIIAEYFNFYWAGPSKNRLFIFPPFRRPSAKFTHQCRKAKKSCIIAPKNTF